MKLYLVELSQGPKAIPGKMIVDESVVNSFGNEIGYRVELVDLTPEEITKINQILRLNKLSTINDIVQDISVASTILEYGHIFSNFQ